ncbi:DUF4244 domain-containing protein [Kocuria sp. M1R5S2]|uniref:DUF4244 domain-containing protein n=1 Tax=Kocuria rhizosphaerae TaxID=3376285 RepID=UPI00379DFFA8
MSPTQITRQRSAPRPGSPSPAVSRQTRGSAVRARLRAAEPDLGATTVEYAMVVLAAAAFGGVMAAVLASGQVRELLAAIVTKALSV